MKGILVVCHDHLLRTTRMSVLERAGYRVESVAYDHEAIARLEVEQFDLVLLGRKSNGEQEGQEGIDRRLREQYPNVLILRVDQKEDSSPFGPPVTEPHPRLMLATLSAMLSDCP